MKIVRWVLLLAALVAVAGGAYVCRQVRQHPIAIAAKIGKSQLERAGMKPATATADGFEVRYWVGGIDTGPLLVFLHGANDSAGGWARVAPAFLENFRVVALDLPGHGESGPAEGPLTMRHMTDGVAAVVRAESRGEPAVLVGNSLGAMLAMVHAHRHPTEVARLVAVNGGAITGDPSKATLLFPKTREDARTLVTLLRDEKSEAVPDFVLDDIVRVAAEGALPRLSQDVAGVAEVILDERLDEVRPPVEVIWGASDRLMPLEYAERLVAGLPAARLTTIEACGHIPQAECPDKFVETLKGVLTAAPPEYRAPPVEALPPEGFE